VRRLLTIPGVIAAASLLAACGVHHSNTVDANQLGAYAKAGPVTYQLQVSRELNQYLPEDSGYLLGLPKKEATLTPNQEWYGVFLWAKNQTKSPQKTTDNFAVLDTEAPVSDGCTARAQTHIYKPIFFNNPYVWKSQMLQPGAIQPTPDTTPSFGPIGGELLLFKVPNQGPNSVYSNRPLTLQICGNTGKVWATISLDL
jgi:hypothetical protein